MRTLAELQEETLCDSLATSEQQLADLSSEMETQTTQESELKQKESDLQSKRQTLVSQTQVETERLESCASDLDNHYSQHQTELKSSIHRLQDEMASLKQTVESNRTPAITPKRQARPSSRSWRLWNRS